MDYIPEASEQIHAIVTEAEDSPAFDTESNDVLECTGGSRGEGCAASPKRVPSVGYICQVLGRAGLPRNRMVLAPTLPAQVA